MPDEAILLTDPIHAWDQPGFYLMNSGVKLGYIGSTLSDNGHLSDKLPKASFRGNFSNSLEYNFSNADNIFYLKYFIQSKKEGYAILCKVRELLASKKTLDHVIVDSLYVYIHHDSDSHQKEHISVKDIYAYGRRLQVEPICTGDINDTPISSGKDWELYSITSKNLLIDAQSLFIADAVPGRHDILFKEGWYDQENWNGNLVRWMNNDSQIILQSSNNTQGNLNFQTLSFYRPRTLEVYSGDELVTKVSVPTSFINVSIPLRLIKGTNIVRFHVSEGCDKPSSDSRCLSIAVQNMALSKKEE
jgi:hypothetical protein